MSYTYDWFSPAIPVLEKCASHMKGIPCLGLEIGCFEGKSTVWMMRNIFTHTASGLACIDTFSGGEDHKRLGMDFSDVKRTFLENTEPWRHKISLMEGESASILAYIIANNDPVRYDFVYIDGSHIAKDVLLDAVLSFKLLKQGGIMVFDDYGWGHEGGWKPHETPKPAIDAFLEIYQDDIQVLHKEYHVAVKKK